jgi:hypothetical protein
VQQVHNPYSLVVGGMLRNHRHGAAKKDNKLNNIHSSKTNYTIHFFEKREREREKERVWMGSQYGSVFLGRTINPGRK